MEIKVKLLNSNKYKDDDNFQAAIDRWKQKGWELADVAQDLVNHGDDAVAILWMPITSKYSSPNKKGVYL